MITQNTAFYESKEGTNIPLSTRIQSFEAKTYFEISNVGHKVANAPLDWSLPFGMLLQNALTADAMETISLIDLEQIINTYTNHPGGKDFNRCILKGHYINGYKGQNCIQGVPFIFFDIDVKAKSKGDKKNENSHLFHPDTNQAVFKALSEIAVLVWRSNSGHGMAGILYVPQIKNFLNEERVLHKRAGTAINAYLSKYISQTTSIKPFVFDSAQNTFRQIRYLASQKEKRSLNPTPWEFYFTLTEKPRQIAPGVIDYKPRDNSDPFGTISHQYNNDHSVLDVALRCGFTRINQSGNFIRVKHPHSSSKTSGVIDLANNVYWNKSESFSRQRGFTPAQLECYWNFNDDWRAFNDTLKSFGYKEKRKPHNEVTQAGKLLKSQLLTITDKDIAIKIIAGACYDLKTLSDTKKKNFIKHFCPWPSLEKYFKHYLGLYDYKIQYDRQIPFYDFVTESLPEILNHADLFDKTIVQAETGTGKTTAFIRDFHKHRPNARLLILEPLTVIVGQLEKEYNKKGVFLTGDSPAPDFERAKYESLVVATYQQGAKLIQDSYLDFDYIIIDEVHQLITANGFKKNAISSLTGVTYNKKVIGLTGTAINDFRYLGFSLIEVKKRHQEPLKAKIHYDNSPVYNIALNHILKAKGKTIVRVVLNPVNLNTLKNEIIQSGRFTADQIFILHSDKQVKASKEYKYLTHSGRFPGKIKIVLTTPLIDEGLSIVQNDFTDVVYIESDYHPRPEPVKQFLARFRKEDPHRTNHIYLRSKIDQTPGAFNPEKSFFEIYQGLENEINETEAGESVLTTFNALFANDPYYYQSNDINPFYLAYSVHRAFFASLNNSQFRTYLEDNYNLNLSVVDPKIEKANIKTLQRETRKKMKKRIYTAWKEHREEVLQTLRHHTDNSTIKQNIPKLPVEIGGDIERLVCFCQKDFETLFKRFKRLSDLGDPNPDETLLNESAKTLRSVRAYKRQTTILKLLKTPETPAEEKAQKRKDEFVKWCLEMKSFTTLQMKWELESLGVYNHEVIDFEALKMILSWTGFTAVKNHNTSLIFLVAK